MTGYRILLFGLSVFAGLLDALGTVRFDPAFLWPAWVVLFLILLKYLSMAYDGARILWIGDYFMLQSGGFSGQLGPRSQLVARPGLDPRSTLMKPVFQSKETTLWMGVP